MILKGWWICLSKVSQDEIVYKKIISNKMENKRIYLAKKEKKLLSVKLS